MTFTLSKPKMIEVLAMDRSILALNIVDRRIHSEIWCTWVKHPIKFWIVRKEDWDEEMEDTLQIDTFLPDYHTVLKQIVLFDINISGASYALIDIEISRKR